MKCRVFPLRQSMYISAGMKKGKASYLEVLTAQENLLNAQLADVTNRYNGLISLIDLYIALGGGTK